MNWLAHIYLSDRTPEDMLGNLLGDFLVKVKWKTFYSENIAKGIHTHLEVDHFTNLHPLFQQSCNRISPEFSVYATILIDVFYDHFLAKNWEDYDDCPLEEYVDNFYAVLERFKGILPRKLLDILPVMVQENWLVSYREPGGINAALARLSRRMKKPNRIALGGSELFRIYNLLEEDFHNFIFELRNFVSTLYSPQNITACTELNEN